MNFAYSLTLQDALAFSNYLTNNGPIDSLPRIESLRGTHTALSDSRVAEIGQAIDALDRRYQNATYLDLSELNVKLHALRNNASPDLRNTFSPMLNSIHKKWQELLIQKATALADSPELQGSGESEEWAKTPNVGVQEANVAHPAMVHLLKWNFAPAETENILRFSTNQEARIEAAKHMGRLPDGRRAAELFAFALRDFYTNHAATSGIIEWTEKRVSRAQDLLIVLAGAMDTPTLAVRKNYDLLLSRVAGKARAWDNDVFLMALQSAGPSLRKFLIDLIAAMYDSQPQKIDRLFSILSRDEEIRVKLLAARMSLHPSIIRWLDHKLEANGVNAPRNNPAATPLVGEATDFQGDVYSMWRHFIDGTNHPVSFKEIRQAMKHSSPYVRGAAIRRIGIDMDSKEKSELLAQSLMDDDVQVRDAAALVLRDSRGDYLPHLFEEIVRSISIFHYFAESPFRGWGDSYVYLNFIPDYIRGNADRLPPSTIRNLLRSEDVGFKWQGLRSLPIMIDQGKAHEFFFEALTDPVFRVIADNAVKEDGGKSAFGVWVRNALLLLDTPGSS